MPTLSSLNIELGATAAGIAAETAKARGTMNSFYRDAKKMKDNATGGGGIMAGLGGAGTLIKAALGAELIEKGLRIATVFKQMRDASKQMDSGNLDKMAAGVEAMATSAKSMPLVGNFLTDMVLGDALNRMKEGQAIADAMEKRAKDSSAALKSAQGVVGGFAADGAAMNATDEQKIVQRAKDMQSKLDAALAPLRGKDGLETATGIELRKRGEHEIAMTRGRLMDDLQERQRQFAEELAGIDLRNAGETAHAERREFVETLAQRIEGLRKSDPAAGAALAGRFGAMVENRDLGALREMQKSLREQIELFQATAGELAAYKLKMAGASDSTQQAAAAIAMNNVALQNQLDILRQLKAMQGQVNQVWMDANELQLDAMKRAGATQAQLDQAKKAQGDLAENQAAKIEADQMIERAKQLKEQFADPAEKLKQEIELLNQLLKSGLIDNPIFKQAERDARERAAATDPVRERLEGLDPESFGKTAPNIQRSFSFDLPMARPDNAIIDPNGKVIGIAGKQQVKILGNIQNILNKMGQPVNVFF